MIEESEPAVVWHEGELLRNLVLCCSVPLEAMEHGCMGIGCHYFVAVVLCVVVAAAAAAAAAAVLYLG